MQKREFVLTKTRLCAQARSCFGENPFVCTSVLIVCKRHTPILILICICPGENLARKPSPRSYKKLFVIFYENIGNTFLIFHNLINYLFFIFLLFLCLKFSFFFIFFDRFKKLVLFKNSFFSVWTI